MSRQYDPSDSVKQADLGDLVDLAETLVEMAEASAGCGFCRRTCWRCFSDCRPAWGFLDEAKQAYFEALHAGAIAQYEAWDYGKTYPLAEEAELRARMVAAQNLCAARDLLGLSAREFIDAAVAEEIAEGRYQHIKLCLDIEARDRRRARDARERWELAHKEGRVRRHALTHDGYIKTRKTVIVDGVRVPVVIKPELDR